MMRIRKIGVAWKWFTQVIKNTKILFPRSQRIKLVENVARDLPLGSNTAGQIAETIPLWLSVSELFVSDPLPLKPGSPPSLFLREEHRVVGFRGREDELDKLTRWARDGSDGNVSVALVVGGPGRGKSRLARQLCELAEGWDEGAWIAKFLKEDSERESEDSKNENHELFPILMTWPKPLLLVIDYAERRTKQVAKLVSVALEAERGEYPVRILLIARAEGEWLKDIIDEGEFYKHPSNPFGRAKLIVPNPIEVKNRTQEFEHALAAFRELLNTDIAGAHNDILNALLQADEVEILDIHIAALLAAYSTNKGNTTQQADSYEKQLLSGLMDRERKIWKKRGLEGEKIRSTIAWMAVTNELTEKEDALERLRPLMNSRKERERVAETLKELYPGEKWWGGVKPDRLTTWLAHEELAGMIKKKPGIVAELPDDAFANLLRHLMWSIQRYGSKQDRQALESAIRAGGGRGIVTADEIGVEAGAPVDRIAAGILSDTKDMEVVREVSDLIGSKIVKANDEERAKHANNLGIRLSRLGRREEALAAIEEAVALYRGLAEARPDTFRLELAMSLSNLSVCLSDLGRREEALAAIEEAVALYRRLAKARPDVFRFDLARGFNNLGALLSDLGRYEEALAAVEKAVAIRRELAEARPDAFRPDLAMSFNNLGVFLSNLGRREEALAATEEAVALYRGLAEARPDAFHPDLAAGLNNLSLRLLDLGRREEALAAIEEAAALCRELAEILPDAFRPNLAQSLNNLSICLSGLGRREEALAAVEEAVAIRRELAEARPDAFHPDLASSLNNLSDCLSGLGRREEALAVIEEAAALYRRLAEARPDAFRSYLAASLNNLSLYLSSLGRYEESLATIEEAAALYRRLAEARPDAFRPGLATSLNNLSLRLSSLGRREEALAASEEAVAIYREQAEVRPDAFRPDLAMSLSNLSADLFRLGRREEALAASEEAVAIRREQAEARPEAFRPDLAGSLNNLSNCLVGLGRHEEALAAIEEAVAVHRELAKSRPDMFRPNLAQSLTNLSLRLFALRRLEEALTVIEEAVTIRRELAEAQPDAFRPGLMESLRVLRAILSALGR